MTYNVFVGTLNLAQSINLVIISQSTWLIGSQHTHTKQVHISTKREILILRLEKKNIAGLTAQLQLLIFLRRLIK